MNTKQPERQNYQITPFNYGNRPVRAVLINEEPWFIAKEVCDILGIARTSDALRDFPENEKGTVNNRTPGGKQEMLIVNEPGLYRLVFQSRKPEAEEFKTWVFHDVLPQIRKTGSYAKLGRGSSVETLVSIVERQMAVIESLAKAPRRQSIFAAPALFVEQPADDGEVWIPTTELAAFYGRSRATTLSHARAMGWDMRVSRLDSGSLTYEFRLSSLPETLQTAWRERNSYEDRPGFPLILPAKEARDE